MPVSRRVDATAPSVVVDADLDQAIDALPEGRPWLTVLDDQRRVRGILAISDVVRAYHSALQADARRMSHVSANASIADLRIGEGSPLAGRTIGEAYAGSLAEVLGRAGVLTFDPTHRSAKRAMAPHRLSGEDHVSLWSRIACPTLLLHAAESFLDSRERADVAGYFPSARSEVISGAGHWLHHEKPDEVLRAIRTFLGLGADGA